MTAEKFLNRLPKFVIRQGEVVDIRGPIRDTLQVRPALAPQPAGGVGVGMQFAINPGPAYHSSGLCRGSGLGSPARRALMERWDSSDLSHCLLETVELVRALGWDPESSWLAGVWL